MEFYPKSCLLPQLEPICLNRQDTFDLFKTFRVAQTVIAQNFSDLTQCLVAGCFHHLLAVSFKSGKVTRICRRSKSFDKSWIAKSIKQSSLYAGGPKLVLLYYIKSIE